MVKVIQRRCKKCGDIRPYDKPDGSVNHILHLIITFLTAGAWFIIWFLVWAMSPRQKFRCRECGSTL